MRPEKLQAAESDFRPGSGDDFPVMIEERDISSSVGLQRVSTHCPVANSELPCYVAYSRTPYRYGIVAGAGAGRNLRALEFFVGRGCVLHERGELGNIARSNVQRRFSIWTEK